MANFAYNTITVSGNIKEIKTVYDLLKIFEKEQTEGISEGVSLFHKTNSKEWDNIYMFDIGFDFDQLEPEQDNFTFHFESKYAPPFDTLRYITNLFKSIDIICHSQELSNLIYGKSYITGGSILAGIYLNNDEFMTDEEEEEKGVNMYEEYDRIIDGKIKALKKILVD
ncbi:DUF1281 family ferredoxin-like fold protein [Galbibacter sp. BG1]